LYVTRALALLAVAATLLAATSAASAQEPAARAVPPLFYGANWDGEIEENASADLRWRENARMAESGVESVRVAFEWTRAQPRKNGPFDHRVTDRIVLNAVAHGLDVLPIVILAPRWARQYPHVVHSPPKSLGDYTKYLRVLVKRYGPNGTFWLQNPALRKIPITHWQIWNEPHLKFQWSIPDGNYAPRYGQLLRASYASIKGVDPAATVVLGGLSNRSWEYLEELYRRGRIRGAFDVAALHPYTSKATGVITLAKRFRKVMKRFRDGTKPLWITELGLPASKGEKNASGGLQTTDAGMADFLFRAYELLAKRWQSTSSGAVRVYWYTWASVYCCEQFRYTGLLAYDNKSTTTPKPALERYVKSAQRDQGCVKDQFGACTGRR
jgi:hypothetical protein